MTHTPHRDRSSEHEIAAILMGARLVPSNPSSFVDMALCHRMAPLLVHVGLEDRLPEREAARLLDQARAEAAIDEVRRRELCRVLCALRADGIDVLVTKGAHLACTCYAESHLRPRDDADLLVAPGDRSRVAGALARVGYAHLPDISGDVVHGQLLFGRRDNVPVVLDVHWRVTGPRVAADLLTFEELWRRAVDLPRLGPCARGPAPVDALALACIHQAAHHPEHDLLLWSHDAWLLLAGFSDAEADAFCALAIERQMTRICAYTVAESAAYFPTPRSSRVLERLRAAGGDEPTAFLVHERTPLQQLTSDLATTRGWIARGRLILGHLFPPPAYMRHAYGVPTAALPLAYGYRIVRGAGRWLVRGGPGGA
jgi:hypothetical protein